MTSVIGVDLGGTKVVVARLRGRDISESLLHQTDRSGSGALIDQVVAMINRIRSDDLAAVGIGVPSVVEFHTGRVVASVNIPLADVPLRQVLGDRVGVPVFVDNDATVAALAEAHDPDLRLVARNLVMLTVGTGVGGGIVLDGRIYRGATGGAGEFGHTIIGMALKGAGRVPPPDHFPQPDSLEYLAAGLALDRLAEQTASEELESALGQLKARGEDVQGAEAVVAARDGDPTARRIVEVWAERVGIGIANAINIFDPEEVVIGGGAARAGDLLLEPARRVAQGYVVPGLRGRTNIRLAWHGVRAGVLGAALLAAHEVERSGGGEPGGAAPSHSNSTAHRSAGERPGLREPLRSHEEARGA
jgi:glucokinase